MLPFGLKKQSSSPGIRTLNSFSTTSSHQTSTSRSATPLNSSTSSSNLNLTPAHSHHSDSTLSSPVNSNPRPPILTSTNSHNWTPSPSDQIDQIADDCSFTILSTSKFSLSIKLLDKILYLRSDNSDVTPLRGFLCIHIKKPVRISHILLQFKGTLKVRCFPNHMAPDPNSPFVRDKFIDMFTQSRSWQYKPNDTSMDTDYFIKGSFAYPFQFLIPNDTPETMSNIFGSTSYSFSVTVNPISTSFTKSLVSQVKTTAPLPIQVVQCDNEAPTRSLVGADAMSIGRWRNLLYYKITVANRQVVIGGSLKLYIKILPINPLGYKLTSIKIFLDQITEYHVGTILTDAEKAKYHTNLSNTERILLEDLHYQWLENDIQNWELDVDVNKIHPKHNIKDPKKPKDVILVPSTNYMEDQICHFRVNHKIKVAISVEVVPESVINYEDEASDIVSNLSFKGRSRSQSVDKTLLNNRAEKADNAMIKRMANLVHEDDPSKTKVDLILEAEIEVLKGESLDGKMPPPTYFDAEQQKHVNDSLRATGTSSSSVISLGKNEKHKKKELNFVVPPAYEEVAEQSGPPPYLND